METQQQVQFYPVLNNMALNPPTLGSILETFYTSNQKYFTVDQLQNGTKLTKEEVNSALDVLRNLVDIGIHKNRGFMDNYFFIDTDGSVKHLKSSVNDSKLVLNVMEKILEKSNNGNEAINDFVKSTIVFYSEILDFVTLKVDEHFNR